MGDARSLIINKEDKMAVPIGVNEKNQDMSQQISNEDSNDSVSCSPTERLECPPITTNVTVPENIKQITRDLAYDLIYHVTFVKKVKAPSKHAETMRRLVKEMYTRHEILFNSMIKKVNVLTDAATVQTFICVANEMFRDGKINWGRVASVYAFGGRLAQHWYEVNIGNSNRNDLSKTTKFLDKLSDRIGRYFVEKFGAWIHSQGGWDSFDAQFPPPNSFEDHIWKGLFFTALGLGAVATLTRIAAR